ncbi:MAG: hypothetical protein BV457_08110 [Thermoplasmata archaeon M9B1D]|nr:MAG: hypothetical protein BV457_08110 [Thermoplasmata archaeon M9B1D]PNX50821.1 MAG: hypothetical protein BV456_05400 [Thermoplasmata archaeon M8B2D]
MNQIPIDEEKNVIYNKKAVKIILLLFVFGIVTGLVLSYVFIDEANHRIEYWNYMEEMHYPHGPLATPDIILPSLGVIIICISIYLLLGLIFIYIKIFLKTNSKYIVGLLFFLTPLFAKSILTVNTLRSLFVSPAITDIDIQQSIGFGFGGLGGIIVMVAIFEIIGLSILLYLSAE